MASGSGQQQMMSTEEMEGQTVLHEEEEDEGERPCCFGNSICVATFYYLLEYRPHSGNDDIVKQDFIGLARFDGWVATVPTC